MSGTDRLVAFASFARLKFASILSTKSFETFSPARGHRSTVGVPRPADAVGLAAEIYKNDLGRL